MYIISGCLLGNHCKYNGGDNRNEAVCRFASKHTYVVVCPETAAALPVPREPAEQIDGRILDRSGQDLTEDFLRGAEISMEKVREAAREMREPLEGAILKARSPSCGVREIYDGSFTGRTVPGDGCFAKMLREIGVQVFSEEDLERRGGQDSDGNGGQKQ